MTTLTPALRDRIENTIRFLAVDAVQRANSGHPGAPMGLARSAFQLWDRHLRFDPADLEVMWKRPACRNVYAHTGRSG